MLGFRRTKNALCIMINFRGIRNLMAKKGGYKGEVSITHTRLSDGKETVANAMEKAKQMQMDFYVPTEHNVIHTGWKHTEVMIVPGMR